MTVIGLDAQVQLARKARLRADPRTGRMMLLYPERGLDLSASAAAIAALCTEPRTVTAIVDGVHDRHPEVARARVEADVLSFLQGLADRGLLTVTPGAAGEAAR
jgi:coenzyme PQQ biosynthesis protein PqqD